MNAVRGQEPDCPMFIMSEMGVGEGGLGKSLVGTMILLMKSSDLCLTTIYNVD